MTTGVSQAGHGVQAGPGACSLRVNLEFAHVIDFPRPPNVPLLQEGLSTGLVVLRRHHQGSEISDLGFMKILHG